MIKNKTVSFNAMKYGTVEDYKIIAANDDETAKDLPDRLIEHLKEMGDDDGAYKINRLDHVLQCATRAYRDGADKDWIIAGLFHDIGDVLAPYTHGQVAAEIIRPFVKEEVTWVVRNHGSFQMFYNVSLPVEIRNTRDKFSGHQFYNSAVDFCEKWDQNSFDPNYDSENLDFFIPLIKEVFSRRPFSR